MTNQEWQRRSAVRILREVAKAGRIRVRALKQRTHYNRGPDEDSIAYWSEALWDLERQKLIALELDADGWPVLAKAV